MSASCQAGCGILPRWRAQPSFLFHPFDRRRTRVHVHLEQSAFVIDHSELIDPAALFALDLDANDLAGQFVAYGGEDVREGANLAAFDGFVHLVSLAFVRAQPRRCCCRQQAPASTAAPARSGIFAPTPDAARGGL